MLAHVGQFSHPFRRLQVIIHRLQRISLESIGLLAQTCYCPTCGRRVSDDFAPNGGNCHRPSRPTPVWSAHIKSEKLPMAWRYEACPKCGPIIFDAGFTCSLLPCSQTQGLRPGERDVAVTLGSCLTSTGKRGRGSCRQSSTPLALDCPETWLVQCEGGS